MDDAGQADAARAFVGGWDGAATEGSSVLLLREGLTGTLSAANLKGDEFEYHITYNVEGEADEMSDDVVLGLGCAEIRVRPVLAPASAGGTGDGSDVPQDDTAENDSPGLGDDGWSSMDCAGWELDLRCGLAGECGVGDCNMLCDVVFFGDAYATAAVTLTAVEDEFDHWQRV